MKGLNYNFMDKMLNFNIEFQDNIKKINGQPLFLINFRPIISIQNILYKIAIFLRDGYLVYMQKIL